MEICDRWVFVETQTAIREAIVLALGQVKGLAFAAAASLTELAGILGKEQCRGVLVSYSPKLGRWDELQGLLATWSLPRVLLDDRINDLHLHHVLNARWHGYLTKEQSIAEIVQALRDVARGERVFAPDAQRRVLMTAQGPQLRVDRTTSVLGKISKRELDVLLLVAQGFAVRQIGELLSIKASTVENHKTRMMRKLRVHKAVDLARIAIQEGLLSTAAVQMPLEPSVPSNAQMPGTIEPVKEPRSDHDSRRETIVDGEPQSGVA